MNIIGVIPARMASSRFPDKPLAKINGMPMLGHVYKRAKLCSALDDVYVATCDNEIKDYIESIDGKVVMTKYSHERASDRSAEAMFTIEKTTGKPVDMVVMIQGDEPILYPDTLEALIEVMLKDDSLNIVNVISPLKTKEEQEDPNEVKVVCDLNGNALYFSREPIPSIKKGGKGFTVYKQIGIILFKRDFLAKFINLEPTPLEKIESVDMLRVLEHGYKVKTLLSQYETYGVDTIEDLKKVERLMKKLEL